MTVVDHFIGGKAVANDFDESSIYNPSTGEKISTVLHADIQEVDLAVAAAKEALVGWSVSGLQKRADILLKAREILSSRASEFVEIMMLEGGKTREDAMAEFGKGLEAIAYASGVVSWYTTHLTRNVSGGIDTYDARFPIGVVGTVSPFNFPVMIPVIQSSMAIACGNTVVAKASEKVPTCLRKIAEVFKEAGLPDGVLNVINGDRVVVDRILEHPDVAGVTFVGSTTVAKKVRVAGVANDKKVQAFGSGKNHMIVLPDADMDMAADAAVSAAYGAAGQRCMAISVLVAVGDAADSLVEKIKERIPAVKTGPATTPGVQLGPVISRESKDRIHSFIASAEGEGAEVVVDGRDVEDEGYLVGATLFDHVKPGMSVYDNEIFGPALSVVRVDTLEEAMEIAEQHPLGNGAALFTRDGGVAREYVESVQAGMVGINIPIPVPTFSHSFGGWKDSAFTETKVTGPESLSFYTRIKAVTTRWPDPAQSSVNLTFMSED
ncbi:CoA-acylating methylmalonate-semialdehyde dehydrogenase [Maricurvus nonylphenolicus]|uniref:CoA-acylating methylmalonate-semialdehyde dehydrogenase n=1 Tax=Maricurvus nonylphenolicus TaxID=1008307 RepID=UPI0036F1D0C6